MTELLTAEQMRNLEKQAIDSGVVSGLELMERAGQGVVDAVFARWPDMAETPGRAVVLCGPGNNGGDGFVIARLLAERGWACAVNLFGEADRLPPDARTNFDRWSAMGDVRPMQRAEVAAGPAPDLMIDAVFGIGLTRALPRAVAEVLDHDMCAAWPGAPEVRKVAVDCPSGLNLDTGDVPQEAAGVTGVNVADLTVTFQTPKPGHYLAMGPAVCREVVVVDIGVGRDGASVTAPGTLRLSARTASPGAPDPDWPLSQLPKMRGGAHKYDYGHVMVFAGGVGRGGAGRLAARAALRIGAGLVTLVCPRAALQENAMRLDAVMLRGLDDPASLAQVADDRVSGFCVGPAMGVGARTRDMVRAVLRRGTGAHGGRNPCVVLDADALTSFAEDPDALFETVHARTILTPHEGEFARLFPDLGQSERGSMSKVDAVRAAAARAGCVVLLKGADTVVASPDGAACLHAACYDRAVPWLATAGAGDVLAGAIAGVASSPLSPDLLPSAEAAVWLHTEAARAFGPGLIAEDLPEALPGVLRGLQA
ncbi:NAD(P)H-hydrate dehydratase [Roseobacter sp. S98]|uniref:NAD(P)H-hydrate dehydratase n=1 Tax=Roseobacter algicola (ex Choi et al. 2025) (nom. illeg.) TaxID=3092138 RepID=UPI003F517E47